MTETKLPFMLYTNCSTRKRISSPRLAIGNYVHHLAPARWNAPTNLHSLLPASFFIFLFFIFLNLNFIAWERGRRVGPGFFHFPSPTSQKTPEFLIFCLIAPQVLSPVSPTPACCRRPEAAVPPPLLSNPSIQVSFKPYFPIDGDVRCF